MPKVTIPTKCAKCGSEKIKHEELLMLGRLSGRGYRFDVFICMECKYAELFYRKKLGWFYRE